ncbi:MAG: T9SS type A sorting domain-containing protein [Bacteroidales bacterium]
MKHTTFAISLILIGFVTQVGAQEYIPLLQDGKIWNFTTEYYPEAPDNPGDTITISYLLSGDTVINSTTYQILYQIACAETANVQPAGDPVAFLRENTDSQRVFIYSEGEELLLYDFSLQEGDTVHGEDYAFESHLDMVVTQTDSILINENYCKQIDFNVTDDNNWTSGWTESTGGVSLLDYIKGDTWYSEILNCLYEDGLLVYYDTEYNDCCPEVTGIEDENVHHANLKIYPNPAMNTVQIEFNDSEPAHVSILDIRGKLVHKAPLESGKAEIDLSHLPAGVYVAKITGSFGVISRKLSLK